MSLRLQTYVDLPNHVGSGGFDHAAVYQSHALLYVAHTANDSLDVIDCAADRYLHSIPDLKAVAGALISEEQGMVFTSNRGENTVSIFPAGAKSALDKVPVGVRPNGLSFDPNRSLLLAANVGDPAVPGSFTLSMVDVAKRAMIASIPVPGRTRWTVFDAESNVFFVNIADPAHIISVNAAEPDHIAQTFDIPAVGPHGLDIDLESRMLFCACDDGKLISLDMRSGKVVSQLRLFGPPDVIFFNPRYKHLYVAVGDPGVIDVFDTSAGTRIETVVTEKGAHTIAFDAKRNKVYAFLPETHRAIVYFDAGPMG